MPMKKLLLAALFALLPFQVFAQGKVSEYPETTDPQAADYLYIIDSGSSGKAQVGSLFGPYSVRLTSVTPDTFDAGPWSIRFRGPVQ